jgi:hypothetical protein
MAVGFKVYFYWYQIGPSTLLFSFFSTVCLRLENNKWGSKYPFIMNELYQGKLKKENVDKAIPEINGIVKNFLKLSIDKAIWDIDNLDIEPPERPKITKDMKKLIDFFITNDGDNVVYLLNSALKRALELNEDVIIHTLGGGKIQSN